MLLHSCDSERYLIPSERLYRAKAWWCPRVKCTLRCLPTSLKMAEYMSTSHMKDHFPGVKEDSFIRSERQFLAVLMLAARFECSNGITKSDATEIAAVVASTIQRLTGKIDTWRRWELNEGIWKNFYWSPILPFISVKTYCSLRI